MMLGLLARNRLSPYQTPQTASATPQRNTVMSTPTKIYLDESEMPTQWYNVVADLPEPPPPPLHPGTHQPATGDDFAALFPKALIEQEMSAGGISTSRAKCWMYIGCGGPARYFVHTASRNCWIPLHASTTSTRSESGGLSHKPNTAVPQVWYNAQEGIRKADYRDGRRPVGQFARLCLRAVRA